jgi:hypothetical protein
VEMFANLDTGVVDVRGVVVVASMRQRPLGRLGLVKRVGIGDDGDIMGKVVSGRMGVRATRIRRWGSAVSVDSSPLPSRQRAR